MITEKLKANLLILFIGFNPSLRSYERGFNYAGRSNRFYKILYLSGLTDRLFTPEESPLLLDEYQYGFTNLVSRPTARADEVTKAEYRAGAQELYRKLTEFRPTIACYVGKGVYLSFANKHSHKGFGFTEKSLTPYSLDFVAPATSGLVRMKLEEQVSIYRGLAEKVQHLRILHAK
ncbi:mismatch-specific DNA-glycosylase [Sulfoacidibacillus thermotolerans]|uniref:Uracil-DNA glycosylase-like domain-containing protein n=1 Tax=Sulfoacidibacillus thermotolerans TaxID=1765684 RepID=A0A2U3D7B6_SULT2|nr:mismatch-specific DNA-glycosylase [Sulfoacidibacillus thermotolerans]PWI57172.1 hypothetical protein BM613_09895 [Sulfoacidibacillus thermotolerans]